MVQVPLIGPDSFGGVPRVSVLEDYGQIRNAGACLAHTVLAENGQKYIIKGPTLNTGLHYAAANELIAASLARLLGLPVLDFCVAEMSGGLYFASSAMPDGTFYPITTEDLFLRCENRERVYALVTFDAWICNGDRHAQNLIVRRVSPQSSSGSSGQERLLLLLNDHSHCLMPPNQGPGACAAQTGNPVQNYVSLDFVRTFVRDTQSLRLALDAIEALNADKIAGVIHSTPEALLRVDERQPVLDFLLARRAILRSLFVSGRQAFANLEDGDL
jgi:hypothetical protein